MRAFKFLISFVKVLIFRLYVRFRNAKVFAPVNLDRIQHWIEQGRLQSSPESPITARELVESGCVHDIHDGIKLLGDVRADVYPFKVVSNSSVRVRSFSRRLSISHLPGPRNLQSVRLRGSEEPCFANTITHWLFEIVSKVAPTVLRLRPHAGQISVSFDL